MYTLPWFIHIGCYMYIVIYCSALCACTSILLPYVVYHKLSTGSGNDAYIHYIETERFPVSLDKVFVIDI